MLTQLMTLFSRPQLVPELNCDDAETSKNFYVDILEFSVLYERPNDGFFYLVRDGAELMIEQVSAGTWKNAELEHPYGRGMNFEIKIKNVQELYDRCIKKGAKIFREIEDTWYRADNEYIGQRQFIILDPDGFMLRFAENLGRRSEPPETGRRVL